MKKERWYEDQPILKADLDREQAAKEAAIFERVLDGVNSGALLETQLAGESSALLIQQGPNAGLFITVNTGVAYSPQGERIVISAVSAFSAAAPTSVTDNGIGGTTVTPQSTGSQNVPVANGATNSVWLGYLEITDSAVFTLNNITNERLFVKREDGFEIQVTTTSTNPDSSRFVLIGEVTTLGGVVTSINTANTKEALTVGPTAIPGSPFQIALSLFPNLPFEMERPASIPSISGFTYTTGSPAAGQFTVNFKTGIVTFNSADTATSVTINYLAQHTRRPLCISRSGRPGGNITLNTVPSAYEAGTVTTFTEHINARGTGAISVVNPHGLSANDIGLAGVLDLGAKLAAPGIITTDGDASSVSSALSPSAVSAFSVADNKVTIAPLVAGEAVNVNGTLIVPSDIPSLLTFDFLDSITLLPLAAGTYSFYADLATKTVKRTSGVIPADSFPVASIVWDGAKLLLPITDLRVFGTIAKQNLRLEALLALAMGAATDNRLSTLYSAKLTGTVVVIPPTYSYTGLGGTTLNVTVNGTPFVITFPALPVNPTINSVVSEINSQVSSIKAVKTPTNQIKLLASVSLTITGGTAPAILGFPVSPASGSSDSGDIKEIRIAGSSSSIGVGGDVEDAEVSFSYDITQKLTQIVAKMGNKTLSTILTYNVDDSLKTVQEIVV